MQLDDFANDDECRRGQVGGSGEIGKCFQRTGQYPLIVGTRLLHDGGLAGVQIQVSSNEATLTGDVESQGARDRAEAIAAAVAGVRYVIDNLRVGQEGTTGATG